MNPMRATIAIMMATLIRLVFPLVSAFFLFACAQETPSPPVNPQETTEKVVITQLMKRAEQGNALAQYNLGLMYEDGKGVPRDYVQAHMWYNLAASQTDDQVYAEFRDAIAEHMTREQITEAQRRAREWMRRREIPEQPFDDLLNLYP